MCFLHRAMSCLKGYKYYRKVRDQSGDFSYCGDQSVNSTCKLKVLYVIRACVDTGIIQPTLLWYNASLELHWLHVTCRWFLPHTHAFGTLFCLCS